MPCLSFRLKWGGARQLSITFPRESPLYPSLRSEGESRIATTAFGGTFVTTHNGKTVALRAATSNNRARRHGWRLGVAATLLLSCSSGALHAESNAELAKEIAELKAQIHEMRGAMVQTRRTVEKVKVIAERRPAPGYALPAPGPAFPAGAIPAFVTADKKMQFGALTITPGGFVAAESVFRSRTTQSDINSSYGAIPFGNNPPRPRERVPLHSRARAAPPCLSRAR